MKQFIKNNLKVFVTLIISGIVFIGIGVYAASQYLARDISYTPSNENFDVNNVEDALNELYDYINSISLEYVDTIKGGKNQSSVAEQVVLEKQLEKGEYLINVVRSTVNANPTKDLIDFEGEYIDISGYKRKKLLVSSYYGEYNKDTSNNPNQYVSSYIISVEDSSNLKFSLPSNTASSNIQIIIFKILNN